MRQLSYSSLAYLKTHNLVNSRDKTWSLRVLPRPISSMPRWRDICPGYDCYVKPGFPVSGMVWQEKNNLWICDWATIGVAALTKLSSLSVVTNGTLFRVRVSASKITWVICLTFIQGGSPWRVWKGITWLIILAMVAKALEKTRGDGTKINTALIQVRDDELDQSSYPGQGEQWRGLNGNRGQRSVWTGEFL